MRFGILGPFEVTDDDGRELALGGRKQRAVLAILVLYANEVVSSGRLIDELWGDRPPTTAAKTVQVYVSNLRKALGDGRLVTRSGGICSLPSPERSTSVTSRRWPRDGRRALRSGEPERALIRLNEALALWRGPPLAEFADEQFAQIGISHLEEARVAAMEDRIDAELAVGEHASVVAELRALVSEHPLRERLRAQMMLALYRSGRQADALEVYRQTRRVLLDDLGLEPGEDLRRLHQAVLEHDPVLERVVPAGTFGENGPPHLAVDGGPPVVAAHAPTRGSARRPRRAVLIAGAIGLGLVAMAAVAALLTESRAGAVTASANSVAVIDTHANRVVAQMPVGAGPGTIAAGAANVWVANTVDHSISEIDPGSRRVVRTMSFGDSVDGVVADGNALWVVDSTRGVARRIDPTFGTVVRTIALAPVAGPLPSNPSALTASGGLVWFGNNSAEVVRIAGGGAGVSRIDVGNQPSGIAVGAGATWVADEVDDTVSRIDSTGGVSATIPVGRGASGIAVGAGAVWVADTIDNTLVRIDPATNSVTTTIPVGPGPRGVAWGDDSVWVANSGDGTVSRIDPQSNRVTRTIRVGQSPQGLVVSGDALWVSVQARAVATTPSPAAAPGVLHVSRERPFQTLDPPLQNAVDVDESQLLYATCAGLLTYPDRPGIGGERLVPDVAQALPSVSADGRTYTFIVRPGFRFSPPSGAPVTAVTFKHTIERALSPRRRRTQAATWPTSSGCPHYKPARPSGSLASLREATGCRSV